MDDIDHLIDRLLGDQDTESEFGRVRSYRLCVRFAEEALAKDRRCNAFLLRAAERLGQAPMALPVVFNRVALPEAARACFYIHEDDGPVLVGNRDGLRYLAALLAELAEAPVPGESIYLDPDFEPFVGDSDGLLVYAENEDWFAALDDGREDELAAEWEAEVTARIMNPA
ncbi:MAG TPA: hypothetical protein DCZ72_08115, partial [Armatimonadetes bacterium]|nr:hypothetical protein [Armatimonadota bacterium]